MPATQPRRNGVQFTRSRSRLKISITNPKKIIAALTPKIATIAPMSLTPVINAISTIITEALTEYSHQRA